MVNLADGHVETADAIDGTNVLNGTCTNGANSVNGVNGIPKKRLVVVGLGMVAVSFM